MENSNELQAAYARDGVVCIRSLIPKDEIAMVLEAAMAFRSNPQGRYHDIREESGGRFFMANFLSHHDGRLASFVQNRALVDAARLLTGASTLRFFYDQLFAKDAMTSAATPWHQDQPFWPIKGEQTVSMWLALKWVTAQSGYLEYVAGSHLWGKLFVPVRPGQKAEEISADDMDAIPDFDDPQLRGRQRMLSWDMEPGDVLCHHPLVVHGTANSFISTEPRIGLSLRYMGDDARWAPCPHAMPLPRDPTVEIGAYPADDDVFPVLTPGPID